MSASAPWRSRRRLAGVVYAIAVMLSCAVREEPATPGFTPPPSDAAVWRFAADGRVGAGGEVAWLTAAEQAPKVSVQDIAATLVGHMPPGGVVVQGEGPGALVALALAAAAPERVHGAVLVAPSGFAAAELLGSDLLNRLLYRLVASGQWAVRELTPHFGRLDARFRSPTVERVLSASDSDSVVTRAGATGRPFVILATDDSVTARFLEAALPTARIETEGTAGAWARALGSGGETEARVEERVWRLPRVEETGVLRFGALVFAASMVSEDIASIGVGLLLAAGRVSAVAALGVTALALLLGDLLLVGAGRWLGTSLGWKAFPVKGEALFWSRFVPGARLPTYVAAGMNRLPLGQVVGWLGFAVLLWTPVIVLLTAGGGTLAMRWFGDASIDPLVVLFGAVGILAVLRVAIPLFQWRVRRRWAGRFLRWRRFEYWPLPVFYAPLLPYLGWLMVRHRSVRAPLLANPGIEAGGLVGESKWQIHQDFVEPEAAYLPKTMLLRVGEPPAAARTRVEAWRTEHDLGFPLIAKPDVAERGRGVRRIRDDADLDVLLGEFDEDLLLQEYVEGIELGVFVTRGPDDPDAAVFAIVLKELPEVVGDGERTVEELVLADPRAMAMAHAYQENLGDAWSVVPAAGERVPLVLIGTHSRGAIFLDGEAHRTDALVRAASKIATDLPGFHFGRLDLRVPSLEALREGRGLRLLEVNGLTAEAAHFYDPKVGAFEAWRWLFRQWRIAFEIGAEHRRRGVPAPSLRTIWALWKRGTA